MVNLRQVKKYHGLLQRPPPIEIDGEEEYKVENILDHRIIRQRLPVSGLLDGL